MPNLTQILSPFVQNSRFETLRVIESVSRGCSEQPLGNTQGNSKLNSFRREWRLPIFNFPSASGKHERFLGDRFIYSRGNYKRIESLFNNWRSFIEGSSRDFGGFNSLPESLSIKRVSSQLLEATLFQEHSLLKVGVRLKTRVILILSIFIDRSDLTDIWEKKFLKDLYLSKALYKISRKISVRAYRTIVCYNLHSFN